MIRETGAGLVPMAEVAFMLCNPVSDGAVGEAGVGLLAPGGEVGHLSPIDDALGHAVPWYGANSACSVAIAPTTFLHLATVDHLVVMLLDLLCHIRHGGVGNLHSIPIHHPPQLVVWREAGVHQLQELGADVGGDGL